MSRLPIPGQDNGSWGDILNDFLLQSLTPSGGLQAASDIADAKSKAATAVQSVNGQSGVAVTISATQVPYDNAVGTIITHTNAQQAIRDLEVAVAATSGGGASSTFIPSSLSVSNQAGQTITSAQRAVWTNPSQLSNVVSAAIDTTDAAYVKIVSDGVYSVTWLVEGDNANAPQTVALFMIETGDWISQNNFQSTFDSNTIFSRTLPLKSGERISLAISPPPSTHSGLYTCLMDITRISELS